MFILVVLIFGVCWLPYHGYFIYVYFDTSIIYKKYTQHVYLGFYWFAMSNAMVNPLIYYWMNARFKQYFRTVICGWKTSRCCTLERSNSYSSRNSPSYSNKSFARRGREGTRRSRLSHREDHRYQNGSANSPIIDTPNHYRGSYRLNKDLGSSPRSTWTHRSMRDKQITTAL